MLTFTEKAVKKIKEFSLEEDNNGKYLRVYVEGGGCAGFQYGLAFDDVKNDSDFIEKAGDVEVRIDSMSSMYLDKAEVDFLDGLYGTGFRIVNPNAKSSCGCGHSFSS